MKSIKQFLNLAAVGLSLMAVNSHATTRNWTGYGADANWLTATNWDTYPIAPAANGDTLVFTSPVRQTLTNNCPAITNTMTFASGGWTLNGNTVWLGGNLTSSAGTNVINVNTPMTAARTITVSADQLTMNGVLSGAFAMTKGGGGTLVLTGTNTFTGTTTIAANTGIVKIQNPKALGTGAIAINKAGAAFNGYLQLDMPGVNTLVNVINGISSTTFLGDLTVPVIENLLGTNTITSPLVVATTGGNGESFKATGGLLILNGNLGSVQASRGVEFNGSGNGVVNGAITNGLSNASFTITKDGTGTWTLNGTNTTIGNLTISEGTIALGVTGSISSVPSVTVNGTFDVSAVPGGWTMNNNMTMSGNGFVRGNVSVPTATVSPGGSSAGTLTFSNDLTLNGSTISVNLSSDPAGIVQSNDLVNIIGNLTANGVNTISIGANPGSVLVNGTYTLIKYGGTFTGSAANFAVANFPSGGRGIVSGYIVANPGVISLVVTGTPPANLVWQGDGSANNWDVATTPDWLNGASSDMFYNNDAVLFDDTSLNFSVNLPGTVSPGYVAVNATNNYSINGAGLIAGANGLVKSGSGILTINVNNSFTGGTIIKGGAISVAAVANSATASPLGAGGLQFNGGTLEYTGTGETSTRSLTIGANGGTLQVDNPAATITFSTSGGWSAGLNTFTKTGPGTVTWTTQQVLEGTNNIWGGILKMPAATLALFGANVSTPVFINGGALDINGTSMSTKPAVVSGMGDLTLGVTNGAIVNSGASQTQGFQFVTLTGDTAFGGSGRWDIRANSTATLSTGGNPYNLIKVGANQFSLVGVIVDPALANIDVRSGIFSYELATTGLGNPANTLSVRSGATLDFWATATPLNKQIALYDGSIVTASSGASTIIGPVTQVGDTGGGVTYTIASGVSINLNGAISGAGNLTKSGAGTMTVGATNSTYTGSTTVTAGKLVLNSGQTGTGNLTVNDSTTLGITVSGTHQLSPTVYTLGTSAGPTTNEFTGVTSTTIAPVNTPNLTVNGTCYLNILNGNFLAGNTYPLISFVSINGSGGFVLGTLPPLMVATVVTNGTTIALNVTSAVSLENWSGAVNATWDIGTTPNWSFNGAATTFINGNSAVFDDTALSNTTINISAPVITRGLYLNNNTKSYFFLGSPIGGTNSLTVQGAGAVTLYSPNNYSGGTILSSGQLNVDNAGALGSGPLIFNGGTIDNNGSGPVALNYNPVQAWNADFAYVGDQDLNLGTGAVTINTNRTLTVNGGGTLTVGGISDNGSNYTLTVKGTGTLAVTRPSAYANGTIVNGGTLVLQGDQTAASGGFLIGTNNTGGGLTIAPGASVLVNTTNTTAPDQIQIGSTVVVSGTTAIPVSVSGAVTNNGFLSVACAATLTVATNGVWLQNNAMQVFAVGNNLSQINIAAGGTFIYNDPTYTVELNSSSTTAPLLNISGLFMTPVGFETVNGNTGTNRLQLSGGGILRLTAPIADITTGASVQFILGNGGGSIDTAGNSSGTSGNIIGTGGLTKVGAGTLTLSGANTYTGDTTVSGGTLALNGSGSLTSTNLIVNGGATLDVSAVSLALIGQVLSNATATAILNGNLDASAGSIGLTYAAGTPAFNITGGTLTLSSTNIFVIGNAGSSLTNGSYKVIAVGAGGAVAASGSLPAVTVSGNGMGVGATASLGITNSELYLVVTGGVAVNPNPTNITAIISGGILQLSWPTDHIGWRLLMQTNNLASGLSANTNDWTTVPGSTSIHSTNITINPATPTEFYRLVYP